MESGGVSDGVRRQEPITIKKRLAEGMFANDWGVGVVVLYEGRIVIRNVC